ncbi:MAG: protein phosphatase CheZ [Alphaproteobacteria bacterium]|nr:protein phosphatase CheZ [Alphaproteobacteria bacterium]
MIGAQARAQLESCLALLRDRRDAAAGRREIAEIVRDVLNSLQGDISARDIRLCEELESLAQYIQEAKNEIAALRPDEISQQHIPSATDELDAIVAATEEATGTILDCTETVEEVAKGLDQENAKKLEDAVTRVYEACNFQDITGQRITKVVKTLKHIEERVNFVVSALGHEPANGAERKPGKAGEQAAPAQDDAALLNGPQLPDNAFSQEDIDALLAD